MPDQSLQSPTIDGLHNVIVKKPLYFTQTFGKSESNDQFINELGLEGHREGGYFKETDRSPFLLENPFHKDDNKPIKPINDNQQLAKDKYRNYSTLIYYLLTPEIPYGRFHKNNNRIIHILQKGRGQYVLIYPDGSVKSFIVGFNHSKGEVSQWVVPGGVYKASFLLPLNESTGESKDDHLLISEVVVPGFEYDDHEFLEGVDTLAGMVGESKAKELSFLLHESN
ncbi:hypothetical protein WICANDRAFT_31727 [Wickerhamomyces anomalus NRRL Y-366-8]|uniref:DUF985 domain-containing protein n=1 Tax=Wickerhamomyces anomalus (strain ATCC 58044 / CBS 1984 / NCYC 433 / NRRL Y-366-8) TaxID=683960 RepID=A0A1E3NZU9_WICAA|nr:uncharacterized protein WICANDRAFT_31727 [Wickerhamomyces anomalus NRRL Y-366-8]ODQ58608.1 hypothetical protein WICANDRAFT_31727 [Wickerhamomyces anomalus NRRL Y-366-8]